MMAAFDQINDRIASGYAALDMFNLWRNVYQQCKELQRRLDRYREGDDPLLASVIDLMVTPEERYELGMMRRDIDTLVSAWETQHRAALGLPPADVPAAPNDV